MIFECFLTLISSLGFGVLFNIKGKNLIFAAISGSISWFFYKLFLNNNFPEVTSLFLASMFLSIYSEVFARILKTPVTTIIICGLIPLVPGAGMYYTMYEIITGNSSKALNTGLNTIGNAGALALGIIFVSTITRQIIYYKQTKHKL